MKVTAIFGVLVALASCKHMTTLTLSRTHMTVKVNDDKVFYKPKEGVMSATYPIFEFSREEWDRTVGTAQDGTVITYEAVESSTSHSAGDPEGAVPEGGFSKPKTVCKIVSVVQPVEKASKPGVKA
mmetsp:Transcript_17588/g.41744  ORF Transcript_17588/g.41744 Transcript_17588/m.41744 type:complete len:126 (+) Transcript_17588:48-425(+)